MLFTPAGGGGPQGLRHYIRVRGDIRRSHTSLDTHSNNESDDRSDDPRIGERMREWVASLGC